MAELFQITKAKEAKPISEFPFVDEVNDLETFVKKNSHVIGSDIEVFGEQVDTGAGGRIDLLALDRSTETPQIVLIELKVGIAQHQVLLQTLRYAKWIEKHTDSIRLLLEKKRVDVEYFNLSPKVIIIAKEIEPELIELSQNQAFDFDFIELKRYGNKENCYLVVDHKKYLQPQITRVSSRSEWSWEKYETELRLDKDQIARCKRLFAKIMSICGKKQWSLTPIFNRYSIAFKLGAKKVIMIWLSDQSLGFKLGNPPKKLGLIDPYPQDSRGKFWPRSGEYYVVIETPDIDIKDYISFMEAAYRYVSKT